MRSIYFEGRGKLQFHLWQQKGHVVILTNSVAAGPEEFRVGFMCKVIG